MVDQPGDGYGMCAEAVCGQEGSVELISPDNDWLGIYCLPHGEALAVEGRWIRAVPQQH